MTTITINKRFCGPKNSGNGGYSCGMLGKHVEGPARARLNMPPPLDTPIDLRREDGRVEAYLGDMLVGFAEPAEVQIELPPIPDADHIKAAHDVFLKHADQHILPYCFVCGPRRDAGDALCLFTGDVEGSAVNADFWTPTEDLAEADGLVGEEYLWAALDCPSYFALRQMDKFCLLGSLTAEIKRRPKPGERLIVMAWAKGAEGRKHYSDSAIVDEKGGAIAAANAIWIELNDPAMLVRLKGENR